MTSPRWRERLRKELRRQRLPNAYVDRLVEELSDHAADLCVESTDAENDANVRLGTPEQLAAVAKVEYQRRTFAGRHPFLMFVAGPVPVVIGTLLMSCLIATYGFLLMDAAMSGSPPPNGEANARVSTLGMCIMQSLNMVVRFVPFALSTWLFVRLGRQSGRHAWSIAACSLVAVAALFFFAVISPETAQRKAGWYFGFDWKIGLDRIVQAAVPLGLGIWMLWHCFDELAARFRSHDHTNASKQGLAS